MQTIAPLDRGQKLATAFASWANARAQLGHFQAQSAAEPDGAPLASSSDTSELDVVLRRQEESCARLWEELTRVAQEVAAERERASAAASESIEREQPAPIEVARAAQAQAGRRTEFLANAGRVLSRSLAVDEMIAAVLELCVPMLGDVAVLALGDDGSGVRRLEIRPDPKSTDAEALRTELRARSGRAIKNREFLMWRSGGRAGAMCPLMVGDRAHGALEIIGPAQSFDLALIDLVRAFAGRVAAAMENASLNARVQEAEGRHKQLLSMLAHELRNPLAPIANAAQILEDPAVPQCTINWARDVIVRHAGQMSKLIDDMLDVSALVDGKVSAKLETLTLASIVEGAVAANGAQLHGRAQTVTVDQPADTIEIQGDSVRLVQALSNLINNASRFSAPETTICVAAAYAQGEVRISVTDPGTGIAPEFLPHIFELFAQGQQSIDRPQGGLGIGLTLVRHVCELHGGRVDAYSEGLGKGTEAVVHLPARVAAARPATVGSIAPITTRPTVEHTTARRRVLVVDDHVLGAETMLALLEICGFEVRVAHEGTSALNAAEVFRPDVVLLDLGLPGMSGFEVARHLREKAHLRDVLLIALTGYGDPESRSRAALAGFDSYMTKPADLDCLLSTLAAPRPGRLDDAP